MSDQITRYVNTARRRNKKLAFAIIAAGFFLPLILLVAMIWQHGSIDNVADYSPLRYAFIALIGISLFVAIAVLADILIRSRMIGGKQKFPFITSWIIPSLSIIIILGLSGFVTLPRMFRTADTTPQLQLTESPSGQPGIALIFRTPDKTVNELAWGIAGNLNKSLKEPSPVNHHWFQMTGLEYGKSYAYRLNRQVPVTFNTPPEAGKEFHFAAAGDPHFGNPSSNGIATRQILQYIGNPSNNYSTLFVLGDTAHLGFMDNLWKEAFSTMSACTSSIPTCYVIGNHDTMFGGLDLYQDYLCPPNSKDESGKCLYKRIDVNNVHFLVLDLEWELEVYTPQEEQWLLKQLESIPRNDWLVVMSHTFYYCSGLYQDGWAWYDNQKTIAKLTPLFEKYGVDLVLSGHKHQTEVLQKNGITYVVVGSFGGPLDGERTYTSPASVWYKAGQFGFADVTIGGTSGSVVMRSQNGAELFKTDIKNR